MGGMSNPAAPVFGQLIWPFMVLPLQIPVLLWSAVALARGRPRRGGTRLTVAYSAVVLLFGVWWAWRWLAASPFDDSHWLALLAVHVLVVLAAAIPIVA